MANGRDGRDEEVEPSLAKKAQWVGLGIMVLVMAYALVMGTRRHQGHWAVGFVR